MRIAGSVIWSTDLIESKTKSSSGKGQPTVTNYSYSASFAVLLSARSIVSVGRIWADGKLLRGAAGDFKSQTSFRLHNGGEDQAVDPLIAAAEGSALTPAHRGCAYAVFENFQLADYGNRIPSLTFEVIADTDPVPVGAIASDVSNGLVAGGDATASIIGFSAYGDDVRGVLANLAIVPSAWFAPSGDGLSMHQSLSSVAGLADAGFAEPKKHGRDARGVRALSPIETVPRTLSVAHYDPDRDYQTSVQQARRPGAGNRSQRIELPAVIEAGAAKSVATLAIARAETGREKRTVSASLASAWLRPGDVVTIDGAAGLWRIDSWSLEAMALSLELTRVIASPAVPLSASAGRVLDAPDLIHGPTTLAAFELPPLDDTVLESPRLTIAATGASPGWRRAALLLSTDGGASYDGLGGTATPAIIGTLANVPGSAPATLADLATHIDVDLTRVTDQLHNADDMGLDGGANLALVGEELLQFGRAVPIGEGRWRLSRLWRGRRGTEAAIGTQAIGDRFILLRSDSLVTTELPVATIGASASVLASGVGDLPDPMQATLTITGRSMRPPSPIDGRAVRLDDGSLSLRWTRRSRAGWRWIDGTDAPIGEESERYRLRVTLPGMADGGSFDTPTAALVLAAAQAPPGCSIRIHQVGTGCESLPLIIPFAD